MSEYFNAEDLELIRQRTIDQLLTDLVVCANRLALLVSEDSDRDLHILINLANKIHSNEVRHENLLNS